MRDPRSIEVQNEYWDDILREFGPEYYIQLRYMESEVKSEASSDCPSDCPVLESPWFRHSHSIPA